MIQENTQAPDFTLPDNTGTMHTLSQYLGKWVLLYFYPKDDTPGCTKEACMLRDAHDAYTKNDIVVLGISKDSLESHTEFISKYSLPFTLLSDKDASIIKLYQADGLLYTKRISYLIDPKGYVAKTYMSVSPETHANEVLEDKEKLQTIRH